jgi:hypothetical protein
MLFFFRRWLNNLTLRKVLKHTLFWFGALWLGTEIISFFSQQLSAWLSGQGLLFFAIGIGTVLYSSRPKNSISYRLNGRDVRIEIRVLEVFKSSDALIIPTNTTFETNLEGHNPRGSSIQHRFLQDFYDGEVRHLDSDIEARLEDEGYDFQVMTDGRVGKTKKYEIGTVIQIRKRERLFFLLAISHISSSGRAFGTVEDLKVALANLWIHIMEKGDKCDIVIPVIGTGFSRLRITREEVVRNIIDSFIASCSSKNYCDRLTIALYPPDVDHFRIDVEGLGEYLKYSCQYAEFDVLTNNGLGTAID